MKEIGVVILNYNKYELTIDCIDAMRSCCVPIHILVVDNASKNESFDILCERFRNVSNVEVIQNKINSGYARGNNFGIRYLFDKYPEMQSVCIMNPDVRITYRDIFYNLQCILESNDDIAAASGLMIFNGVLSETSYWDYPKGIDIALGHSVLSWDKRSKIIPDENGIARVEVLPGSFFMMKRTVYEMLGGLDEGTFLYNEENIFGIQVEKLGKKNALSIRDFYFHDHIKGPRQDLISKLKMRKIVNQSRRYLCNKYYKIWFRVVLEVVIAHNYIHVILKHIAGNVVRQIKGQRVEDI